jgi:HSP20 family molecular chaperone IbpA
VGIVERLDEVLRAPAPAACQRFRARRGFGRLSSSVRPPFVPPTDIFETEAALTIVMEMPGTDKGDLDVSVEDGVLYVEGRVNFDKYQGLQPVYTDYNIGHCRRSFQLSNKIDQSQICAAMKDGVLTLMLPRGRGGQAPPDCRDLSVLAGLTRNSGLRGRFRGRRSYAALPSAFQGRNGQRPALRSNGDHKSKRLPRRLSAARSSEHV